MPLSLGLTLYALRDRAGTAAYLPVAARPDGLLVWLHSPHADGCQALRMLAQRLTADGALSVVITRPGPVPAAALPPGIICETVPPDRAGPARAFLDHWKPQCALAVDGELRPVLMSEAQARGIPIMLADARTPALPEGRDGWYPGLVRGLLGRMEAVMAVDEQAARSFRRFGAAASSVLLTGRMEQPSAVLPVNEAERAALSQLLATRPVWLASHLPEEEEAAVIEAHRAVLRLAHRLLLIIVPDDPARVPALMQRMADVEGWTVACRSAEAEPDPEVQVYLADSPGELGLWYRLAPVTYLCGSLTAGGCRADPLPVAALGSAIVHGPRSGAFGGSIGRLAAAQATALVGSSADLAQTLGELLSPQRAAWLAQAAWTVTTEGAAATERALSLLREMVRAEEARGKTAGARAV